MAPNDQESTLAEDTEVSRMKIVASLWRAIEADDPAGIDKVIDDCDAKTPNEDGRTALMYAAALGRSECVRRLVMRRRDSGISATDKLGRTALHWGALSGDALTVERLREAADFHEWNACFQREDSDGKTSIDLAMDDGHFAIVAEHFDQDSLLPHEEKAIEERILPRIHENVFGVLSAIAPHARFRDVVAKNVAFLSAKERDRNGNSPLHLAAMAGSPEAVEVMLAAGHDPTALNSEHETPLIVCCRSGERIDDGAGWVRTAALLAPVCDVRWADRDGKTALMHAAMKSSRSMVEALIPFSDVNAVDHHGLNAYRLACKRPSHSNADIPGILRPLTRPLDYIRHYSGKDIPGRNLRRFAEAGNAVMLTKLFDGERRRVKAGKELSEFALDGLGLPLALRQDGNGITALMVAARNGRADCVEILLEHGSDPLACDIWGQNALMLATVAGHLDCVRALIPRSHVDAKTRGGETALQLAAKQKNRSIFDELSKVARTDILD
jgi:ankyrin repeat protein